MKVAVSDACIFLDLFELELVDKFFNLGIEIHASTEVIEELFPDQKEQLKSYQIQNKITIHVLNSSDWDAMFKKKYPKTISYNDKIALYLSDKLNCLLLSSENIIRKIAKKNSIDYHGLLWIFEQLIESGKIDKKEASKKLKTLLTSSRLYQQNTELRTHMDTRIKLWLEADVPQAI